MSKIHFLPVKHGDAFIVECNRGDHKGIVVVDGGPCGCSYILSKKIKELGVPDLLVLTHYDEDHIGGILQWIKQCLDDGITPYKKIWANCAGYVEFNASLRTSATDGAKLSKHLNELMKQGLEWKDDLFEGYKEDLSFATIEVISPTEAVRNMVVNKQEDEGKQIFQTAATQRSNTDLEKTFEELVTYDPKQPNLAKNDELANASSIAFILRCDKLSILMLGDSYPHNVEIYLRSVGYSEERPLEVDYVKVSHHGSRNNTSNNLLDIIKCNKYLVSTNGGKGKSNHPDRTAIAHILCHPKRDLKEKIQLIFNHEIKLIEKNGAPFLKSGECEIYNFEILENINEI